ncbi:MAG: undecaprenyl-diphosphate phosphatase [Gammaproteobacteria bacterium]|nr:undecaprenyl-diphosphate phosphatase [Gammaproteobacteria bacterium]
MNEALYLKAALLGVVEGLTEFLPISSTGHLIVAGDWLDFNRDADKTFEVFIQLGAILSVCWYYRDRLREVARGVGRSADANRFVLNLLVAFLPAAAIGFIAHDFIKKWLFSPRVVAYAMLFGGLAILFIEYALKRRTATADVAPTRTQALQIGCAQVLALIPGVSRSGATIMGGMVTGLSRRAATEFSFFLAIPVMFAATAYDLLKSWSTLAVDDLSVFAVGFVMAFISALATIRLLLRFVSQHSFAVFAYYRLIFGAWLLWHYRG